SSSGNATACASPPARSLRLGTRAGMAVRIGHNGREEPVMAVLEVRDVVKDYVRGTARVRALDGVSFTIDAGQLVSIMGPSGSGKSTLLHLLGGLDSPTSGSVIADGRELASLGDEELTTFRRHRLGFVFQFFNLLPNLSVWENVALPRLLDGQALGRQRARAVELLDRVGLGDRVDHKPAELSG